MLEIEHGIPVPPTAGRKITIETATAAKLEVGDSFLVEGSYPVEGKRIFMLGKRTGKKFSLRRDPNDRNKIRVWRIA